MKTANGIDLFSTREGAEQAAIDEGATRRAGIVFYRPSRGEGWLLSEVRRTGDGLYERGEWTLDWQTIPGAYPSDSEAVS